MDLQSAITQAIGGQVAANIGKATGVDESSVTKVIQAGLPVIIGQMANNASTTAGANKLDAAVAKDHAGGSLLDNLMGLFTGDASNTDGTKILGHVLKGKQSTANEQIAQKTGVDAATVAKILSFVAPIVMAYLGRKKTNDNLSAGDLSTILSSQTGANGNPLMDIATSFLDKNKDGSIVDDLLGGLFGKKN